MKVACLLLAAGESSRFGGCKQLALIEGKPLIKRSLETLKCVFTKDIYVVLGAHFETIQPVIEDLAQVVHHNEWKKGIGSSIAYGVEQIEAREEYDGILVALADQLQLTECDFHNLLMRFDGRHIVAAYYFDRLGVPAIFPSTQFESLKKLNSDNGAKSLLMALQDELVSVSLPSAMMDIDTVADLERWESEHVS